MSSSSGTRRLGRPLVSREAVTAILLVLPAFVILITFKAVPLGQGLVNSFMQKGVFVGLANWSRMLTDDIWLEAVGNSVKGLVLLPLFILAPLAIAFALFSAIRGWRANRAVYLLSYLLPAAMSGLIFSLILGYTGPINTALRSIGLDSIAISWFSTTETSMWAVYALVFWAWFGLGTVVYLAALAAIPEDQFEAARLDGATAMQSLRHITIPWVRPTIGYWGVLTTAGLFLWLFPFITTATRGGPGYSSTTPEFRIYQVFTQGRNPEYASALGITLFLIVLAVSTFQVRWMYSHASGQ
jgi:ABC-type sugar transport system permease subunit